MMAILNIKSWKQSEKKCQVFTALWGEGVLQQDCRLPMNVTAFSHSSDPYKLNR